MYVEVNTKAVFHCWCRVGCLKLQSSTWRRANALAHDDGTSHFCVTSVSLMWTTPDGNVCMYVCMYVCMLLPQAEGQGAGWPPVRRPLGPVWQPGEREKGAPSIGSSRAGDHELTWLGRDSMSFADVGEDAEAGGVQLHRRRRQLQGGSGPSDRSARHRTIKCRVPKMSTWWDHLNIILPHVCAIQVCIYVDGGSYDDPKIDWLEADHFKWSVIIDLV